MKVKIFICNMLHVNCYVVYDEQSREAAVIDPGFYWDNEKQLFAKFVEDNNLCVKYLLCTHLHFDHVFGTSFVADKYDVKLCASLSDAPWIDNFESSLSRFGISSNGKPCSIGQPLFDGDVKHHKISLRIRVVCSDFCCRQLWLKITLKRTIST